MGHLVEHTAVTYQDIRVTLDSFVHHVQVKVTEVDAGNRGRGYNFLTINVGHAVVVRAFYIRFDFVLPAVDVCRFDRYDHLHAVRLVCRYFSKQVRLGQTLLVVGDDDNVLNAVLAQNHLVVRCVGSRRFRADAEPADALACKSASLVVVIVLGAAKEHQDCALGCLIVQPCPEVFDREGRLLSCRGRDDEWFGVSSLVVAVTSVGCQLSNDGVEFVGVELVTQHEQEFFLLAGIYGHYVGSSVHYCGIFGSLFNFHFSSLSLKKVISVQQVLAGFCGAVFPALCSVPLHHAALRKVCLPLGRLLSLVPQLPPFQLLACQS